MNKKIYAFYVFFIILLGFYCGTYYAAYRFDFPLKNYFFYIKGVPFYIPYAFFIWDYNYTATAFSDSVFEVSTFILYISLFIAVIPFFIGWNRNKLNNTFSHGNARFATDDELKKAGCFEPEGVCLCQSFDAKINILEKNKLQLVKEGRQVRHNGPEHCLMIAPTGSGKGVGTVIPTLLNWHESLIVLDIKKENFDITSGHRSRFSHIIKFEPASDYSSKYNFLDAVRVNTSNEVADVLTIVEMLVDDGVEAGQKGDPFWDNSAKSLFTGLILHILHNPEISADNRNIPYLNKIINDPSKPLQERLHEIVAFQHDSVHIDEIIKTYIAETLNVADAESTFASIVKTATSKLVIYADPVISKNISVSDFSIYDLQRSDRPVSLYIVVQPGDLARLRPLLRLLFEQFIALLSKELPAGKFHRILFLIDEFTSLRKMNIFEQSLAYMRGYGVKYFLIIQSFTQLNQHYGKENAIVDNCGVQIFYTTNRTEVAKDISDRIGQTTVLVDSVGKSGKKTEFLFDSTSRNTSETGKKLLTPEEIMAFPKDRVMLFIEGYRCYIGKKNIYYQDPIFKSRANLPTPEDLESLDAELNGLFSYSIAAESIINNEDTVSEDFDSAELDESSSDYSLHVEEDIVSSDDFLVASSIADSLKEPDITYSGSDLELQSHFMPPPDDFFDTLDSENVESSLYGESLDTSKRGIYDDLLTEDSAIKDLPFITSADVDSSDDGFVSNEDYASESLLDDFESFSDSSSSETSSFPVTSAASSVLNKYSKMRGF